MQNREQHTRLERNAREQCNSLRDYDTLHTARRRAWRATSRLFRQQDQ